MSRLIMPMSVLLLLTPFGPSTQAQQATLDIYWIDVEGGAATLIVTPEQESILMDAGYNRPDERDAMRIQAAMTDARLTGIDYFIASHFHGDHVGGIPALAKRVPIKQFIDHGESVQQDQERGRVAWEGYLSAAKGKRRTVRPGDKLPLEGVELTFVTSDKEILSRPLAPQSANPYCQGALPGDDVSGENSRSVGYLMSLGDFQFLNIGDLTVNVQHALACPENRLGVVDIFQVPHHGNRIAPQLTWALSATVAILNNGPHKGGSAEGFEVVKESPGLQGIWQLHRALDTDNDHNTTERMTANLSEKDDLGHWIKAVVQADGSSYTITNGRNQVKETYASK